MTTKNSPLLEELRSKIEEKGMITFAVFMDTALYHPKYGYYTSTKTRIGKEGDYYTSTDVHTAFGTCIMRQLEEIRHILGRSPLVLVEVGAGKGLLCGDILLAAREKTPALFEALRYFIVEKSPDFIGRQKKHIEKIGLLDKVSWVPGIKEAFTDGTGIILSNELIDAFPVHRVKYSNGQWREIYVTLENKRFVESEGSLSDQRVADFLTALEGPFDEGYNTEVNLKGVDWIKDVGAAIDKGFVITIDYGYRREELYSPERNRGTLMCYHKHQALEDPYINVGEQDITTHVDFTSLAEAGKTCGLEVTGFTDQSYFLMGCGIEEEFQSPLSPPYAKGEPGVVDAFMNNITLKKLLMPGGMGTTFKVLIQHKGMERPRLRGFGFRDNSKYL